MISHHPSDELLADYARGSLHAGAAMVVACHVSRCEACRVAVADWESVGGALLAESAPAALSDDAVARALARIKCDVPRRPVEARPPKFLDRFNVPAPLRGCDIGFRRWLTPGIWFAPIHIGADKKALTYLVYADRNTMLPRHTHSGRELTLILHGCYCDALGRFEAGDLSDADKEIFHAPAVTADSDCLCLSSADGPMQLSGTPARIIQALAGNLY